MSAGRSERLGDRALGDRALGDRALGDRALGDRALGDRVLREVERAGAVRVGVCGVEPMEEARAVIERRKAAGLHASMNFTYRNPARSTEPIRALPSARSAVVAALPYHSQRGDPPDPTSAAVARYAAGDAYTELRAALTVGAQVLSAAGYRGVVLADDNALVDRAMAHRAGLGWFGKNTNILVPGVGSWVVLGTLLTDADLCGNDPAPPAASGGCGSCSRCMEACPTGALVAPGVLDANRCLSWLLQAEGEFPRRFRVALGTRIYGCDDCQEVCPPNRKAPETDLAVGSGPGQWVELCQLLCSADCELLDRLGAWYIPRRQPRYLRRNALVALGNCGVVHSTEVVEVLRRYLADEDPLLVGHAAWAARRLGLGNLLEERPAAEHPEVLAELARPHPALEVLPGVSTGENGFP